MSVRGVETDEMSLEGEGGRGPAQHVSFDGGGSSMPHANLSGEMTNDGAALQHGRSVVEHSATHRAASCQERSTLAMLAQH